MDPCSRFERWLEPYVDEEVDAIHILEVEDHLERCEICSERVELLRAMRGSLRKTAPVRAPASLHERLAAALRERDEAELADAGRISSPGRAAAMVAAPGEEAAKPGLAPTAPDNVRELAPRISRPHAPRRAAPAAAAARPSQLSKLRYAWPLAAAAVFVLVLVTVRPDEEPARLSGHVVETTQERANRPSPGNGNLEAVADDVGRRATAPSPAADAARRNGSRAGAPVMQSDPTAEELAQLSVPEGVSTDTSEFEPLRPASTASPSDPAETAFTVLGLPPGENVASESLATLDTIIEDLVAQHAEPLPPETTDPKGLERFDRFVGVRVAKPRYEPFGARYVGARLHPVNGRRTAMLQYVVGKGHRVTLYVFDSQRVPMKARVLKQRPTEVRPTYVGQLRGYTVAASENAGVGYALASDLDTDESTKLVLAAAHP